MRFSYHRQGEKAMRRLLHEAVTQRAEPEIPIPTGYAQTRWKEGQGCQRPTRLPAYKASITGYTPVEIAFGLKNRSSMKTLIVLIAFAWLAAGCATYSDRGAPGYPEG